MPSLCSVHPIDAFFFDPAQLQKLAESHREAYRTAEPFPHIVIDDFLPEPILDRVAAEFPSPDDKRWIKRAGYGWTDEATGQQATQYRVLHKRESANRMDLMGPHTRNLVAELQSGVFMEFLERLTGIERMLPDPHLIGGGLHSTGPEGRLRVHADFVWNERIRLDRRVNLVLYLNKGWREEQGGHLELWDAGVTRAVRRVLPVFNRCVIFTINSTSWHGHPTPVSGSQWRNSMAFFYYTAGRPAGDVEPWHQEKTLWKALPGEELGDCVTGGPKDAHAPRS